MKAPVSPAEAKAILDVLPDRKSLAALRRELARRGQPVSYTSLRKWRQNQWQRKTSTKPVQASLLPEARAAAERVGLPTDVIRDLEAKLTTMTDGDLVVSVTRRLLIGAGLLLELAKRMAPELMRSDPRKLAALYIAASRMTEGAHASMTEARNLAERAMREKLLLLQDFPRHAERDDQRNGDRGDDRPGVRPFAPSIDRFGTVNR